MSNMKIDRNIYNELKYISKLESCQQRLQDYLKELKPQSYRTPKQNSSLHLAFTLLANDLNDAGLEMNKVLIIDIPWSPDTVKKHLFKPVMKAKTLKESTTELDKTNGEIDEIWDIIMKRLGEKWGVEYIPFPSEEHANYRK